MRRGRLLVIAWRDEAATLYRRYQQETRRDQHPRWHALWLLRTGRTVRETARVLGGCTSARGSSGWPGIGPAGWPRWPPTARRAQGVGRG